MAWKRRLVVVALLSVVPVCVEAAAAPRAALAASTETTSPVVRGSARGEAAARVANRGRASAEVQAREAGKEEARFWDLPVPMRAAISKRLGQERVSYHVQGKAGRARAVRFANAAQGLRAEHDGQALRVEVGPSGVRWGLAWQRLGCGEAGRDETHWERVGRAERQRLEGNEAEWERRAGGVVVREWVVNGPLGLQQGFTLEEAPDRCGGAGA